MKKSVKILIIILLVAVIAGVIACLTLYSKGILSFYHPNKQEQQGQIKVACVGDSVTYGFGITPWHNNNYPAVLQNLLGEDYCVKNFGYSGRTVQSTGDRPYTKEQLYRETLDYQPDIVIFMLGSNDSKPFNWNKENFIKEYKEVVSSYVNLSSKPQVYVIAPPPVFEVDGEVKYNIQKDVIANEIVPAIKQAAKEMNLPCIDMYSVFENKPELFSDGCHPNIEGAKLFAQTVYEEAFEE